MKSGMPQPKALIQQIKSTGVPTGQEELNTLADIVGHYTQTELKEMMDFDTDQTLFLLKSVWNITDVCAFYVNHFGYESGQRVAQIKKQHEKDIEQIAASYQVKVETLVEEQKEALAIQLGETQLQSHLVTQAELESQAWRDEFEKAKKEITELKALLWDLTYVPK